MAGAKKIFELGERPLKSEVVAAWNRMCPSRLLTMEVDPALLMQCVNMMRTHRPERYVFEINRQRGNAWDAVWNEEKQRYEVTE